jgi:hypothetical protein
MALKGFQPSGSLLGLVGSPPPASASYGQGAFSIGLTSAGDCINVDNPQRTNRGDVVLDLKYIDSYDTLYSMFGYSAGASFRGFGGEGGVSYEWAREVQLSSASVYLLFRARYISCSGRIVAPRISDLAHATLVRNSTSFQQQYGDQFINEIYFGRVAYVLIEINAESYAEQQMMTISAKATVGGLSSAAELYSRVSRVRNGARYSMSAHQVGIPQMPPAYMPGGGILEYFQSIFDYTRNITTATPEFPDGAELEWHYDYYTVADNRVDVMPNLQLQRDALSGAVAVYDAVEKRQLLNESAIANPSMFSQAAHFDLIQARRILVDQKISISAFIEGLIDDPMNAALRLPVTMADLPPLPVPVAMPEVIVRTTARAASTNLPQIQLTPVAVGLNNAWAEPSFSYAGKVHPLALEAIDFEIGANARDLYLRVEAWGREELDDRAWSSDSQNGVTAPEDSILSRITGLRITLSGADSSFYVLSVGARLLTIGVDGIEVRSEVWVPSGGMIGDIGHVGTPYSAITGLRVDVRPLGD